ncbi:MAG: LysR family transcriptional regulator [Sneathiella sp.]
MDRLSALKLFARVCECGSITGAGRELGMSSTAASRTLQNLETDLGVKLLNRSTRNVAATEVGHLIYRRIYNPIAELDLALQEAGDMQNTAAGIVHVTARRSFALAHIVPILREFGELYPRVEIALSLTEVVNILPNEETDIVVRAGIPDQKTFIVRALARHKSLLCASPEYLQENGTPKFPEELIAHACLGYKSEIGPTIWHFEKTSVKFEIPASGPFSSNSGEALRLAAVNGMGFVVLPHWLVKRDLEQGNLVNCLLSHQITTAGISPAFYAVHNRGPYIPAKITVFVDFLADKIKERIS